MAILEVFDSQRIKQAEINTAFDITENQKINKLYTFSFSIALSDSKIEFCLLGNFVRLIINNFVGEIYRISSYKKIFGKNKIIHFTCEHPWADLSRSIMYNIRFLGQIVINTDIAFPLVSSFTSVPVWLTGAIRDLPMLIALILEFCSPPISILKGGRWQIITDSNAFGFSPGVEMQLNNSNVLQAIQQALRFVTRDFIIRYVIGANSLSNSAYISPLILNDSTRTNNVYYLGKDVIEFIEEKSIENIINQVIPLGERMPENIREWRGYRSNLRPGLMSITPDIADTWAVRASQDNLEQFGRRTLIAINDKKIEESGTPGLSANRIAFLNNFAQTILSRTSQPEILSSALLHQHVLNGTFNLGNIVEIRDENNDQLARQFITNIRIAVKDTTTVKIDLSNTTLDISDIFFNVLQQAKTQ